MVERMHVERLRIKLSFEGLFYVDNPGLSGGLALLWRKNNNASLLSFSKNHIDVEIRVSGKMWRMTCFYGFPQREKGRESWELLRTLGGRSLLPWVVIRDFNDLLYQYEKKGRNPHLDSLLRGFGEVVDGCGLVQMAMRGHPFTWEKSKGTYNWIEERLDKVLATASWGEVNGHADVENIRTRTSDHSALFLCINAPCTRGGRGPRGFKFEMAWLLDEGCRDVVETTWNEGRAEGLLNCQQQCGNSFMRWGGEYFQKFGDRIKQLRRKYDDIRHRRDPEAIAEFHGLENQLPQLEAQEDIFWRQRAKQHWLHGADANTKFYHMYASARKKKKIIDRLKTDDGVWVEGENMSSIIVDYFKGIFATVGTDVSDFVINSLNSYVLPDGLNDMNIVLIPKKSVSEIVADKRPIALSNVLYRIMAKMISNRMKPLMGDLISESQSAFIPGRLITDNILVASEIGHYLNRKQCGLMGWEALKLDMAKAYDRMEWSFMRRMLEVMGRLVYVITESSDDMHDTWMQSGQGSPPISHMFFVDDGLLFFKANIQEASVIKQCLISAILGSLTDTLQSVISSASSARDAWNRLSTSYAASSRCRIVSLKARLTKYPKGNRSIKTYMREMRAIADDLALAQSPISEEYHIFTQLGDEFNSIVAALRVRTEVISYGELPDVFTDYERLLKDNEAAT
ncbi:PREDICTED: uncharacterized protein LOC109146662 [Ipomoea nil]|uniref:uncharacterized protein LOC109146662 n=1 Tax=Ipomoea nil TaxID=35883 RepID=UPI0009009475|nr:PREDICTED: uncharacterized protein LOC109146662 [Ipomoea nil]